MKRIVAALLLAMSGGAFGQTDPNTLLASAKAYQTVSEQGLMAIEAYCLAVTANFGLLTPSQVLSNAAAYYGLDEKSLLVARTYLAGQQATVGGIPTLRTVVGGTNSTTAISITNVIASDGMALITFSTPGTQDHALMKAYNAMLSEVIISNATAGAVGSVTFGVAAFDTPLNQTNCELRNVKIYGKERGMVLQPGLGDLSINNNFYHCWFEGQTCGAEVWRGIYNWYNCTFEATNSSTECAPFIANDFSQNTFYGGVFNSDNTSGAGSDFGMIVYTTTTNTLYNCVLQRRKAPSDGTAALISIIENNADLKLYNCTFKPFGALAINASYGASPVGVIRLENCVVDPPTNGVIVATDSGDPVYVLGGNLQAVNFNNPQDVIWLSPPTVGMTNRITSQAANYAVTSYDQVVLLNGNLTATLPTAVGIPGKQYTVMCKTAGTNAILSTSAQTFLGYGNTAATKWTNSVVGRSSTFMSDGANWLVLKSDN